MKQISLIPLYIFLLLNACYCWGQLPALTFGYNGNATGCAPHTVVFSISNVSSNIANTTYQLNFGDGSPVLNYTQTTIPTTVSHTYTSVSCGQTFSGQQNCFGATLTATNTSGPSTATVFPIRISKKPNASFTLSQASICAGSSITFTNISDPGVTYSGSTCNTNPPYYWQVTGPSQGTVVSGILGSNGTFPANINAWTTGSSPLAMQFTTAGNYQMKLSIGNSCGIDDTTLNFTVVNSSPAISAGIPGNLEQCAPASLNFSLSNFESNSSETIYTVTYDDGGETQIFNHPPPSIVSHTFTESSCGQTTPVFNYVDAFSVTITAQNSCSQSSVAIEPIRISTPPIANYIGLPNTACTNNPIVLTNTANLGNNVNAAGCNTNNGMVWSISPATGWSVNSGALGSTNGQPNNYLNWTSGSNQLSIVFTTAGNYTFTQRIRNSCGEDTESQTVSITSNGFVNAGFDQSLCLGSAPIQLNGTPAAGIWSGAPSVNQIGLFTPNIVGSYSLTYSTGTGACVASDEINIEVNAVPNVTFALEDTLFCTSDAPITLSSGTPVGGIYSGSGVNGNQFDPTLTFVGESTIGYSYTDFNGCSNLVNENVVVEICTFIANSDKNKSFHLYPNPSPGVLNIQLLEGCSFAEMSVFSIDGQLITQKLLIASTQTFDFSYLSSGVYFIRLQGEKEIVSLPWYKFN